MEMHAIFVQFVKEHFMIYLLLNFDAFSTENIFFSNRFVIVMIL